MGRRERLTGALVELDVAVAGLEGCDGCSKSS